MVTVVGSPNDPYNGTAAGHGEKEQGLGMVVIAETAFAAAGSE